MLAFHTLMRRFFFRKPTLTLLNITLQCTGEETSDDFEKMILIFVLFQAAEQIHTNIVKRFSQDKDVWIHFGQFYFHNNKVDQARKLMQRSLRTLDRKHREYPVAIVDSDQWGNFKLLWKESLSWLMYIDGDGFGYGLAAGFQTQWRHRTVQNLFILHRLGSLLPISAQDRNVSPSGSPAIGWAIKEWLQTEECLTRNSREAMNKFLEYL